MAGEPGPTDAPTAPGTDRRAAVSPPYDLDEFNALGGSVDDLFFERYQQHGHTKIGGWPSWIQSSVGSDGYVFQVGSEAKTGWMWGNSGNGYFFFRGGKWFLHWDSY